MMADFDNLDNDGSGFSFDSSDDFNSMMSEASANAADDEGDLSDLFAGIKPLEEGVEYDEYDSSVPQEENHYEETYTEEQNDNFDDIMNEVFNEEIQQNDETMDNNYENTYDEQSYNESASYSDNETSMSDEEFDTLLTSFDEYDTETPEYDSHENEKSYVEPEVEEKNYIDDILNEFSQEDTIETVSEDTHQPRRYTSIDNYVDENVETEQEPQQYEYQEESSQDEYREELSPSPENDHFVGNDEDQSIAEEESSNYVENTYVNEDNVVSANYDNSEKHIPEAVETTESHQGAHYAEHTTESNSVPVGFNSGITANEIGKILAVSNIFRELSPTEVAISSQLFNEGRRIKEENHYIEKALKADREIITLLQTLIKTKEMEQIELAFYLIDLEDDLLFKLGSLVESFTGEELDINLPKNRYARKMVNGINSIEEEAMKYVSVTEKVLSSVFELFD